MIQICNHTRKPLVVLFHLELNLLMKFILWNGFPWQNKITITVNTLKTENTLVLITGNKGRYLVSQHLLKSKRQGRRQIKGHLWSLWTSGRTEYHVLFDVNEAKNSCSCVKTILSWFYTIIHTLCIWVHKIQYFSLGVW